MYKVLKCSTKMCYQGQPRHFWEAEAEGRSLNHEKKFLTQYLNTGVLVNCLTIARGRKDQFCPF